MNPPLRFSKLGRQLAAGSGIGELMEDLGRALAEGGDVKMLGGGQPAHIPEIDALWRRRMEEVLASPGCLERVLGNYDPPRGNQRFIEALVGLLRREFGWPIGPEHVAITVGGQTAFFILFNLLAGEMPDGSRRQILLPLMPEYIGYANQGSCEGLFRGMRPRIDRTGEHSFKYGIDFDALEIDESIAAICVSRPTNPSGNVLTDEELSRLSALAKVHGIPLVIDNAYGAPFPDVIFTGATPLWDEHVILTLSLSKLGLPGTRTGIVIGPPGITAAIAETGSVIGLANPNLGQEIVRPLLESGEILSLARETVRPYYQEKSRAAQGWVREAFADSFDYAVHASEGALFLWLWFPGLPIGSRELYERLKRRGVLVVPGDYFFYGLEEPEGLPHQAGGRADASPGGLWRHREECLRMTFTMDPASVRAGIAAIADEVRSLSRV